MKIALCFIINYNHILNKEDIWREWIEKNKDIINVYFYYKNINQIKSEWILKHTIPSTYIYETSYYYVIPAYISIMKYALLHDTNNEWFCMLTDSCCPIISPNKFRYLFYKYYNKSIIRCNPSWWNIQFHKRANLLKLPKELHLANDPWFVLKKKNVIQIIDFMNNKKELSELICKGGLANESLFAIILYCNKELNNNGIISNVTHIADWNRMSSGTSPHIFKEGNENDIIFINKELKNNEYVMFIRKIGIEFPNDILKYYIYEYDKTYEKRKRLLEYSVIIYINLKNILLILLKNGIFFYCLINILNYLYSIKLK